MLRVSQWLIELGKGLVELGDHLEMQRAQFDALGSSCKPPKAIREIREEEREGLREALIASRAACSEDDWLRPNGRRDQECVRYNIAPEQVAGILAGSTKREKKNSNGNGAAVAVQTSTIQPETLTSPAQKTGGKNERNMFDPKEWGEFPLENGGSRDQIPTKMFRTAMEMDKDLVILVYKLGCEHKKDWNTLRTQLCCTRRLTRQQVAAIIAEHTKQENKKFAAKAAHA